MASKNRLLVPGGISEPVEEVVVKKEKGLLDSPIWIYNLEFPRGKIIRKKKELDELKGNWVSNVKEVHTLALKTNAPTFTLPDFEESDIESKIDLSVKTKKDKKG